MKPQKILRENWEYISCYSFYNLQAFQVFHLHFQFVSSLYLVSFLVIYLTATSYPKTYDLKSVYYHIVSVGDESRQGWVGWVLWLQGSLQLTSRCEPGCMTGGTKLTCVAVRTIQFLVSCQPVAPSSFLACVCLCVCLCVCARMHSVMWSCPTLGHPMDCSLPSSSVHGIFPGKNTGVGCHFLLQSIFPTQGWNPHLLYLLQWQAGSLPLAPLGKRGMSIV